MPASASAFTPASVAASEACMPSSHRRRAWMPATSWSTSVLMPRRSRVGLSRALISSLDRRRGASMWARPAMATCWKSMGWPPEYGQKGTHITGFRVPPHSAGPAAVVKRSVPATPGGELLVAVQRRAERADGVGADPRGLVAGQGFEHLAHAQGAALV